MTIEGRIEKARNKLSSLLAYASTSLGTDRLADTDRFPSEYDPVDGSDMCPNCVTPWKCNGPHELSEPMTTLWEWEDEQRKLKGPKE